MASIFHYFPINVPIEKVFEAISTPEGLDKWWAKKTTGNADLGGKFFIHFEPNYDWTAVITKFDPYEEFELTMQTSDEDWEGSKVGFRLTSKKNLTEVQFYHIDWKEDNTHFRISNFCWAMYLRILKRNLELGEIVEYKDRLNA